MMPFSKSPSASGACVRFAKANATSGRRMPTKTRSPSRICRPAAMTISSRSVNWVTSALASSLSSPAARIALQLEMLLVQNEGLGRGGAVGMLPDGLLVDLDAQAGTMWHLHEAVPRLDRLGKEGGLVHARGELHRRAAAPR